MMRPPVWQLIRDAMEHFNREVSYSELKQFVLKRNPGINNSTLNDQISVCSVNQRSRIDYRRNKKPRPCTSKYDFLYHTARGRVEPYDPKQHGHWEIYQSPDGALSVRRKPPTEFAVPAAPFGMYYILNTNIANKKPDDFDMVEKKRAAAFEQNKEDIDDIPQAAVIFLYESGLGIRAFGTIYGKVVRAPEKRHRQYHYKNLQDFKYITPPVKHADIRKAIGKNIASRMLQKLTLEEGRGITNFIRERCLTYDKVFEEMASDVAEPPKRVDTKVRRIIRDSVTGNELKNLYEYRCQVCGIRIEVASGSYYIEVHHLQPLGGGHNGLDIPSNMVVLCPNHHAMFDLRIPEFVGHDRIRIGAKVHRLACRHKLSGDVIDYHNELKRR